MWHQCKVCKNSTEGDNAVCWNTSSWMGTNYSRSVLTEEHALSSSCWLLQLVPHVIRKLQSLHSVSVIKQLKEIFMKIGVPRCVVSDGGTQFTSQEFKVFTRRWDIHHRITSSTNAQSNGQAEHFVQTIKNSLMKAMEGGEDLHLAILLYITTPLNHSSTLTCRIFEL